MVKILRPKVYEAWVKRQLLNKRVFARKIEMGKPYLFLYEDKEMVELGSLSTAPIVLPLRPFSSGFNGINLAAIPRRDLRTKIFDEYRKVSTYKSDVNKLREALKLERAIRANTIMKPSFGFFKYNKIKSKVVEVQEEDVRDLIRRTL